MRRILPTDPPIPNTIDRETKRALKERSIVRPEDVVFDLRDDSWARDGREDLPVSAAIVGSIILAHDTDNRSDESADSHFEGNSREEGKRAKIKIKGNPVIWGSLSAVQLTVMGTNETPVLVMSAAGRQTAKASEWLTLFFSRCHVALRGAHEKLTKDREEAQASVESLLKRVTAAKKGDDALRERLAEAQKSLSFFEGKDLHALAVKAARAEMRAERDPVTADLLEEHFDMIFEGSRSSKLGKPMVGLTYSVVVWLSVSYGSDLPTERRSLEKSKLANLQVSSLPSTEAESVRRLVRDYVISGSATEERALDRVRQFVRPLMAVGAPQAASPEYVWQLYRLDMLCLEAKRMIDAERDPRKMLALFDRLTRQLFKPAVERVAVGEDHEVVLTRNAMSDDEQRERLAPKKPTPRVRETPAPKAPATVQPRVLDRLRSMRSPMTNLTEQQRADARAVLAWEAYRAGDTAALRDFPHLAAALVEEAEDDGETPLAMALDAVDHWSGKGHVDLPAFAERQPKDDAKIAAWAERERRHNETVKAARALIDDAMQAMPASVKADHRSAWLHEHLSPV